MALDDRFVTSVDLEEPFRNKDNATPLANGSIWFYVDTDRTTPKLVYTLENLSGPTAPPNYAYVELPNPVPLNSIGVPSDIDGNNIPIYYFPYDGTPDDSTGVLELYYVVVKNSLNVVQFTREGWPNIANSSSNIINNLQFNNAILNPQFVDINFALENPLTIPFVGAGTDTIHIAPNWDLVITHTNNGTVTIDRAAIAGNLGITGNPPYVFTINPGLNITDLFLRQRLSNNPDIYSPQLGGSNGYVATSLLLGPGSNATVTYQPNTQPPQIILSANNLTAAYREFNQTVQLDPANNASTGDTGYVDIIIDISAVNPTTLGNFQVVGLNNDIQNIPFLQVPSNVQKSLLFNYYNPLLQYKPIKSYLVGWDFHLNPTQFLGPTLAASAAGANTSRYVWDQTIVFQSANSGPAISRSAAGNGALRITATNTTEFALIQYLPQSIARRILNDSMSVNVSALTPFPGGLVSTVSLWYTTDVSLPSTAANNSLVASLGPTGKPLTFHGNWTEVIRNLGDATFTVGNSATTNFNEYGFSGWSEDGIAGVNNATFFAIVVGFASLTAAGTIDIDSISLVPGSIPTRPAPQTPDEVLRECQFYYEMSFNLGTIPAQNATVNHGESNFAQAVAAATAQNGNFIPMRVPKNISPTVTLYNPAAANALARDITTGADTGATAAAVTGLNGFVVNLTTAGGSAAGDQLAINWSADSRLGL